MFAAVLIFVFYSIRCGCSEADNKQDRQIKKPILGFLFQSIPFWQSTISVPHLLQNLLLSMSFSPHLRQKQILATSLGGSSFKWTYVFADWPQFGQVFKKIADRYPQDIHSAAWLGGFGGMMYVLPSPLSVLTLNTLKYSIKTTTNKRYSSFSKSGK